MVVFVAACSEDAGTADKYRSIFLLVEYAHKKYFFLVSEIRLRSRFGTYVRPFFGGHFDVKVTYSFFFPAFSTSFIPGEEIYGYVGIFTSRATA